MGWTTSVCFIARRHKGTSHSDSVTLLAARRAGGNSLVISANQVNSTATVFQAGCHGVIYPFRPVPGRRVESATRHETTHKHRGRPARVQSSLGITGPRIGDREPIGKKGTGWFLASVKGDEVKRKLSYGETALETGERHEATGRCRTPRNSEKR